MSNSIILMKSYILIFFPYKYIYFYKIIGYLYIYIIELVINFKDEFCHLNDIC